MNILKRPMFFAAVTSALTAVISLYFFKTAFVFLALAAVLILFVATKYKFEYFSVFIAVLIFGISLFGEYQKIEKIKISDGAKVKSEFIVLEEPIKSDKFNRFTAKALKGGDLPKGSKYVLFDYDKTDVSSGDIINAVIRVTAIKSADEYRLYDYGNSVYASGSVLSAKSTGKTNKFYKFCANIREYVTAKSNSVFDKNTVGFLIALTIGDKSQLSDKFLNNVKTTGISHIIVVSGMHLSIILSSVFLLLDKLFYNKYVRSALSLAFVILISGVCGFTMSVTRAGVMFVIMALAPLFSRENDSLSSLCTAVVGVLISAPFAVVNVSFLLSVMSTLAIIWAVPFYTSLVKQKLKISSKAVEILLNIVFCSVFAMIFTLPITVKIFGFISVVAPLTNLLVTYPVMLALICNVAAMLLSVIPVLNILSYPLFSVANYSARFIIFVVNKMADLPITVAVLPKSFIVFSLALIALIIAYMYVYDFKKKRSV